ncbi:MAG: hypothetical protein BWK78_02860 [Thiotrichaceae bacterium IS1]|nr:MAG: hypothetical protein BWK78_02860 [Thiotrichaceae bacterium IS1]
MNVDSSNPQPQPPKNQCNKAIKLLEQYERLMKKYGKEISPKTLKKLQTLGENITSADLSGTLQSEFPDEFSGLTLKEIRKLCGKSK